MKTLALILAGLLVGAIGSGALINAGCCPSPTQVHSGTYGQTPPVAETDYRMSISTAASSVVETFSRAGTTWEIDYTIVD